MRILTFSAEAGGVASFASAKVQRRSRRSERDLVSVSQRFLGLRLLMKSRTLVMRAMMPTEAAVDTAEMVIWISGFMENHQCLCSTTL